MMHIVTRFRYHKAIGLLLLRAATGLVFINHGWMKLAGLAGAQSFFKGLGLPAEAAVAIAVIEVVGGIMLVTGVASRLAGLVLGITMVVALVLVGIPKGTHELEMMLAAASLAVFFVGSGKYALYSMERE